MIAFRQLGKIVLLTAMLLTVAAGCASESKPAAAPKSGKPNAPGLPDGDGPECVTERDCADKQVCLAASCVQACDKNADCPEGQVCLISGCVDKDSPLLDAASGGNEDGGGDEDGSAGDASDDAGQDIPGVPDEGEGEGDDGGLRCATSTDCPIGYYCTDAGQCAEYADGGEGDGDTGDGAEGEGSDSGEGEGTGDGGEGDVEPGDHGDGGTPDACTPVEEICDSLDNDCDSEVDEGDLCPESQSCIAGLCLTICGPGEIDLDRDNANGCEYHCARTDPLDDPDDQFIDANCDGIDGMRVGPVYVATTGDDQNSGLEPDKPVKTIGHGIALAIQGSREVYVAAGDYPEQLVITGSVRIFGGYGPVGEGSGAFGNWRRAPRGVNPVRLLSGQPVGLMIGGPIHAWIDNLIVIAATNTAQSGPSIGVHVAGADAYLMNLGIAAGGGGNGGPGASGGPGAAGENGGTGPPGKCEGCRIGGCDQVPYGGPTSGGASACGAMGGAGGALNNPAVAGATVAGGGAGGAPGQTGKGGQPGLDGAAGGNGPPGSNTGEIVGEEWHALQAPAGEQGKPGGGGGGGGMGSSGDVKSCYLHKCFCAGSGGGSGGGGGCGGLGGTGGYGGGASIGILVLNSSPAIAKCDISTSAGGLGGEGIAGGPGAAGGQGGPPGQTDPSGGGSGANGDHGGAGGLGGAGGGGGGGPSIGIMSDANSNPILDANNYNLGTAGPGGLYNGVPGQRSNTYKF